MVEFANKDGLQGDQSCTGIIFESFFHFVLRAEQTGKRTMDQWIQQQLPDGSSAITNLFVWTQTLRSEPSLVDKFIKWILERKVAVPAPLFLEYFKPWLYSVKQFTQLINKGFNPKVCFYMKRIVY